MKVIAWFIGLFFGIIAAAQLFVIASLVTDAPRNGQLALLLLGFGIAFFPSALSVATNRVRTTIRRSFTVLALLGLVMVGTAGYRALTSTPLLRQDLMGWLGVITSTSEQASVSNMTIWIIVIGLLVAALGIVLAALVRPPAPKAAKPAPETTTARPIPETRPAPPAIPLNIPGPISRPASAPQSSGFDISKPAAPPTKITERLGLDPELYEPIKDEKK